MILTIIIIILIVIIVGDGTVGTADAVIFAIKSNTMENMAT